MDNKPKIYTDRETRKNDRFVFVSYSHRDDDPVFNMLNVLYDKGVDYWYDVDFEIGDAWDERAQAQLRDKNCVGAIVFISFNTCMSDACHREAKWIMEQQQLKTDFLVLPVIIGYKSMSEVSGTIRDMLDDGKIDQEFIKKMKFPVIDKLKAYREITKGDSVLFVVYDDDYSKWVDAIMKPFERINVVEYQVFRLENTAFTKLLHAKKTNNKYYIQLGNYDFEKEKDNSSVEWLAVRQNKNTILLVSKYVIDYVTKDDALKTVRKVKESVKDLDFVEDLDIVSDKILQMDGENIGPFIPTDYADSKRTQILRLNFIKNNDNQDEMLCCNYNGQIMNANDLILNLTCGVRLALTIDLNKIPEGVQDE